MTLQQSQSTVIFVQSTAHWEAILQQRAQLISASPSTPPRAETTLPKLIDRKTPKQEPPARKRPSRLIGKEGSRRRQRWTNNTFSDHPSAVLYAEDLRPPGYERQTPKYNIGLISSDQEQAIDDDDSVEQKIQALPHNLSRHVRHDLKKAHISKGLVANYETRLIRFIDVWLNDIECLENVCLEIQVVSNNQFERYVLHTMSRYYGFSSFSKTNEHNQRLTYICHPAYLSYINNKDAADEIDYSQAANWFMPEKSFFEYLFHSV